MDLNQQLSQQQILAPQMRQGLEILQASSLELTQVIQNALSTNPVLEQHFDDSAIERAPEPRAERDGDTVSELADHHREEAILRRAGRPVHDQESLDFIYDSIVAPKTLQQHLLNQLNEASKEADLHHAAEVVIWSLDDRGFLSEPIDQIAIREGLSQQELISACGVVQQFTPAGIAARDIEESLLIQLAHRKIFHSLETKIITDHLKELALKHYPAIAKKLGVNVQAITEAASVISTLTLNPAAEFDPISNPHVRPDVIISFSETGDLQAHLTGAHLPKLSINEQYKELLATSADTETRKYLKDQIRDGRTLISSLTQRQDTLIKITEVLLDKQSAFFSKGAKHLKPLTMNEVAEIVELHPTTISRAATSKYILSPQGLHELRYFFTTGVKSESGSSVSNTSIRDTIKDIVDQENPKKPYSDSAIEKMLKQRDIKVARRTIAKYRDQLGILPSHLRKQF